MLGDTFSVVSWFQKEHTVLRRYRFSLKKWISLSDQCIIYNCKLKSWIWELFSFGVNLDVTNLKYIHVHIFFFNNYSTYLCDIFRCKYKFHSPATKIQRVNLSNRESTISCCSRYLVISVDKRRIRFIYLLWVTNNR